MEYKFELGPLQRMWLDQLRKHPERQAKDQLGYVYVEDYKACCLGELHLCAHRINGKKFPFVEDKIVDGVDDMSLETSYELYGLRDPIGSPERTIKINGGFYDSLSELNDGGITWPEIADIVEADPENFFTKSV